MSVQSEIDRIITAVGNAYSKVSEKGGTVPASQTVANLATAIDSIPAGSTPSLQSKSVTYTSNGTYIMEPDYGYDGLSSVDVTVNVSGGYNLKKVRYNPSSNKLLKDVTITHNCGSIPKFVIVTSTNSNVSYLMVGFGANESQTPSFSMMINTGQIQASVTSTTFTYIGTSSLRYHGGSEYTYYFFY